MDDSPADPNSWARAIAAYLQAHPHASDTAEGIARWWLHAPASEWPRIQRALDRMVARGWLERVTALDGRQRYRLPPGGAPPP